MATIAVIGGLNLDVISQPGDSINHGDSVPGIIRQSPGGVARNIAENLAHLGHRVRLISVTGDDPVGNWLLEDCYRLGIDCAGVKKKTGYRTACYLAFNDHTGQMRHAVNDMEVLCTLTAEQLTATRNLLVDCDYWIVDTNLGSDCIDWLFRNKVDKRIFVEAVSRTKVHKLINRLSAIDCLQLNRHEAGVLSGIQIDDGNSAGRAVEAIEQSGVKQVVITLGRQGVVFNDGNRIDIQVPPVKPKIVNDTGAGDALLAGWVHACSRALPMAQQMAFAQGCAALTLSSHRANHPGLSEKEVNALL